MVALAGSDGEPGDSSDSLEVAAAQLGLRALPGRFVHGFSAAKWLPRRNFEIEGTLFSPEVLSLSDPTSFNSIREVPLNQLQEWRAIPPMALLPRAATLLHAQRLRVTGRRGELPPDDLTLDQAERLLNLADFELAFESARRLYAPGAPSRLSCVYLAEDTPAGRRYAQSIATMRGFVIPVRVPFPLRVARVDANWIGPAAEKNEAQMQGYWAGAPAPGSTPLWEWLVDGVIRCDDSEALELVRNYTAGLQEGILEVTAADALEAGWPHADNPNAAAP